MYKVLNRVSGMQLVLMLLYLLLLFPVYLKSRPVFQGYPVGPSLADKRYGHFTLAVRYLALT